MYKCFAAAFRSSVMPQTNAISALVCKFLKMQCNAVLLDGVAVKPA